MQPISRDELRALLDADTVTLDELLPEPHYRAEQLPGAVNLPGELAAGLVPDPARTVVTYRAGPSCGRSKIAAAAFTRLGHLDVRVYDGGKTDWAAASPPFEGTRTTRQAA